MKQSGVTRNWYLAAFVATAVADGGSDAVVAASWGPGCGAWLRRLHPEWNMCRAHG